jgi:hypothetical protein
MATRRRPRVFGSCWTRRPVVTISSPTEDREEEEGWEDISTHDSATVSGGFWMMMQEVHTIVA